MRAPSPQLELEAPEPTTSMMRAASNASLTSATTGSAASSTSAASSGSTSQSVLRPDQLSPSMPSACKVAV